MIAEELVNEMIPALSMKDNAEKAILWMGELRTNFLPVIEKGQFKGFVSEDIIFENNDLEKEIREFKLIAENCYVNGRQHYYDVIRLIKENHIDLVAVIDDDQNYMGVVTIEDIINALSQSSAIQNPGAIIILSINKIDYSLAEVTRLVEENNVKVLSSYVKSDPQDSNKLLLTLKINMLESTRVIATLERFGYNIVAQFLESDTQESHQDRLNLLLKYIDI
jgi:signal-transduction protein with cAMP-binding, CBS, and nucleotidyltransferase domain